MSHEPILNKILENYPDEMFLKADGFDGAILGVELESMVIAYSCKKCIDILKEKGYEYADAIEFFEFSVKNVDFGKKTPIFIEDNFD